MRFQGCIATVDSFQLILFLSMIVSILLFAIGAGAYAATDTSRDSCEAATFALTDKNRWSIGVDRMIEDAVVVARGRPSGRPLSCAHVE